jgi:hypothetical protein
MTLRNKQEKHREGKLFARSLSRKSKKAAAMVIMGGHGR